MTLHRDQDDYLYVVQDVADVVFLGIFTVEAILKILAHTWLRYIKDSWNKFDFALVVIGFATLEFFIPLDYLKTLNLRVLRIFRIMRIFRIIPRFRHLQMAFKTFIF